MSDDSRRPPTNDPEDFDYERIFREAEAPDPPLMDRLPVEKLKKTALILVPLFVLLLLSVVLLRQFNPPGSPIGEVNLEVAKGSSTTAIAEQLDAEGVIPSATAFKLWVRKEGDASFQAGEYALRRNMSAGEALSVLRNGPKQETNILTIPEGWRLQQIANRVGQIPGLSAQRFMEIANSGEVQSTLSPPGVNNLEGLLFPDTYLISDADDEERLLRRMVRQMEDQARAAGIENALATRSRTPYEIMIIASMIESEARVPEDRGKISQVIDNRLQQAMPLQIDATVLYALGNDRDALSLADLKVQSPYNTYQVSGLPVAPISNPGLASIKAALEPTPGPWIYYVVKDEAGAHAFATTFAEHERNVAAAQAKNLY